MNYAANVSVIVKFLTSAVQHCCIDLGSCISNSAL